MLVIIFVFCALLVPISQAQQTTGPSVFSQETFRPGESYGNELRLLSIAQNRSLRNKLSTPNGESVSKFRLEHVAPPKAVHAFDKGHKKLMRGDWTGAAAELEKAVGFDPQFYDAHNDLGFAYERQDKYAVAAREFNSLIRMDPHDHLGYMNLGIVYYNTHNWAQSEQMARHALTLDPVCTRASLLLGMSLLAEDQRTPEARKRLELASSDFDEARSALAKWNAAQNSGQ